MRPLHPIIRESLSFRHAVLADTCVIATLLSTTTYSLYGLQCKHAFANVCRHLVCVACVACVACVVALHDHVLAVRAPRPRVWSRLQISRLRRFSVPYVALRRVPPSFVSESSLCRRRHRWRLASLHRSNVPLP